MKMRGTKSFCKNISQLVLRRNVKSAKNTRLNFLTNHMTINVNVFGTLMKNRIGSNVKSNFTVTIKESRLEWNLQVSEKVSKPYNFTAGGRHGSVLSLSRRTRDCGLFLGFPRNQRIIQKDTIAGD
jgi:hypothetical protein